MRTPTGQRGFTLVELLVALALMALMAALSWRGLDGMTAAQKRLAQHADAVLTLQTGLAQWGADLDALAQQPNTPSIDWDGRALRLLRRGSQSGTEGLHVVAWSQRRVGDTLYWLRWQSPELTTRAALQTAWNQAARWGQNPSDEDRQREVRITPVLGWQIFFYRGGAWTNPLSSADAAAGAVAAPVGDASNATLYAVAADNSGSGKGRWRTIAATSASDRTNTSMPGPSAAARADSIRAANTAPSRVGDENTTLPLARNVATSAKPSPANTRATSAILTMRPPTLTARRKAT
jgi:general secretion pathway protein J